MCLYYFQMHTYALSISDFHQFKINTAHKNESHFAEWPRILLLMCASGLCVATPLHGDYSYMKSDRTGNIQCLLFIRFYHVPPTMTMPKPDCATHRPILDPLPATRKINTKKLLLRNNDGG